MAFITARRSRRTNYIGIPGTSTFGVGLADEKDYKAVLLEPADKCLDPTDFQYGLYVRGSDTPTSDLVAMKWIPKFYIKQLQKNDGTVNLDDGELEALLPYVEVTKEQMKEAQRRSPHNALVVAPADRFTDEADANARGFYLMRGFIDGGKEYDGFFLSNTLATYTEHVSGSGRISNITKCVHLGANAFDSNNVNKLIRANSTNIDADVGDIFPYKVVAAAANTNFIERLANTKYQCCSIQVWAVISILSLIQGQYVTDIGECAWYDSNLATNFPKGINLTGITDIHDPTVTITPAISLEDNQGGVFAAESAYAKTTHNGSITGVTNVNGWLLQMVVGAWGDGSRSLKRSASIYDITRYNADDRGASYYETKDVSRISETWGGNKSSLPDLAGEDKDFFGIYAFGGNSSQNSNEFGEDGYVRYNDNSVILVNGGPDYANSAGIFFRAGTQTWRNQSWITFRAMAYPRQQI